MKLEFVKDVNQDTEEITAKKVNTIANMLITIISFLCRLTLFL